MKRLLFLTAILAVFGLSSCQSDSPRALLGTWEATSMEVSYEGISMNFDLEELGIGMSFTFKNDKTGYAYFEEEGEGETSTFEYYTQNSTLFLSIEGEEMSVPYEIQGKNMAIIFDGEIIDEEGTVKLHLVKK